MQEDPPAADGHENSPQAVPVKYVSQAHVPAVTSQMPRLEHSLLAACAVSEDVASSNQAVLVAQVRKEQSAPVKPLLQLHTNVELPAQEP